MAMNRWGLIGFMVFEGGMNTNDFLIFLNEMISNDLLKNINKKFCFFLDNASIHKSKRFMSIFGQSHTILYNAPYSPQLNPIELVFGVLKKYIREKNPKKY